VHFLFGPYAYSNQNENKEVHTTEYGNQVFLINKRVQGLSPKVEHTETKKKGKIKLEGI
jgi:hypothetical protein